MGFTHNLTFEPREELIHSSLEVVLGVQRFITISSRMHFRTLECYIIHTMFCSGFSGIMVSLIQPKARAIKRRCIFAWFIFLDGYATIIYYNVKRYDQYAYIICLPVLPNLLCITSMQDTFLQY